MADIKYEIKEKLGTLSESSKGWTKELNLISWNGVILQIKFGSIFQNKLALNPT